MSKVLLVVFFLANGRIDYRFVELDSLAACQMRAIRAANVLREDGLTPLGIRCIHRMDT